MEHCQHTAAACGWAQAQRACVAAGPEQGGVGGMVPSAAGGQTHLYVVRALRAHGAGSHLTTALPRPSTRSSLNKCRAVDEAGNTAGCEHRYAGHLASVAHVRSDSTHPLGCHHALCKPCMGPCMVEDSKDTSRPCCLLIMRCHCRQGSLAVRAALARGARGTWPRQVGTTAGLLLKSSVAPSSPDTLHCRSTGAPCGWRRAGGCRERALAGNGNGNGNGAALRPALATGLWPVLAAGLAAAHARHIHRQNSVLLR